MYSKDDVSELVSKLESLKIEPDFAIELAQFGLAAYLFDPVSGQIITLAQPHRVDVGQPGILLTAEQAERSIASMRALHLHNVRSMGYASIEAYNDAQLQARATRDLAHKQAVERARLDEEQATARAAAAAPAPNDAAKQEELQRAEAARRDEALAEQQRQLQPQGVGQPQPQPQPSVPQPQPV